MNTKKWFEKTCSPESHYSVPLTAMSTSSRTILRVGYWSGCECNNKIKWKLVNSHDMNPNTFIICTKLQWGSVGCVGWYCDNRIFKNMQFSHLHKNCENWVLKCIYIWGCVWETTQNAFVMWMGGQNIERFIYLFLNIGIHVDKVGAWETSWSEFFTLCRIQREWDSLQIFHILKPLLPIDPKLSQHAGIHTYYIHTLWSININ